MANDELGLPPETQELVLGELRRLEDQDGKLEPYTVLAEAEHPDSPLHDYFEWDDTEAAQKFRLAQAHALIIRVKVLIKDRPIRAYQHVNVQVQDIQKKGYYSVDRVLSDAQMSEYVLKRALRELEYWQKKYENTQELVGLIDVKKVAELKEKI